FSRDAVFSAPVHPQWQNYEHAWLNWNIGRSMLLTAIVVAAATLSIIIISAPAAYALARFPNRSANQLSNLFAVGMGIPIPAIVLPLYIAYAKVGLINSL